MADTLNLTDEELLALDQSAPAPAAEPAPQPQADFSAVSDEQLLQLSEAPAQPLQQAQTELSDEDLLRLDQPLAPVASDAEVSEPPEGFLGGLQQGLRQNLTGLAFAAVQGNLEETASEEVEFSSLAQGAGYVAGQLLDPLAIPLASLGGGAVVKAGQIGSALLKFGVRKSAVEGAKALERGLIRQTLRQAVKSAGVSGGKKFGIAEIKSKVVQESLAQALGRSAGEAGGVVAGRAVLDPSASAGDLAGEALVGTALGAATRGAGRLLAKSREGKLIKKSLKLLNKQKRVSAATALAESEAKVVQRRISRIESLAASPAEAAEEVKRLKLSPQKTAQETLVRELGRRSVSKPKVIKRSFTSPLKLAARIDEGAGTNLFPQVNQIVQAGNVKDAIALDVGSRLTGIKNKLNKLGRNNQDITDLLEHTDLSGNFLPEANPARPGYQGLLPSSEEQGVLAEMREAFNTMRTESDALTGTSRARDFYVPRYRRKFEKPKGKSLKKKAETAEEAVEAAFEQKREQLQFNPEKNEGDIQTIIDRYASEQGKVLAFEAPINNLGIEINKLGILGQKESANDMARYVADVLDLEDVDAARAFFSRATTNKARPAVAELLDGAGIREPETGDKVMQFLSKRLFNNLLFTTPTPVVKNALQLEMIAPAEVGMKYVQQARALNPLALAARKTAKEHLGLMVQPNLDFSELTPILSPKKGLVFKALDLAEGPFKVPFSAADRANRVRAFAAATLQWEDLAPQGQLANVLEGLLPSESALVLKTLNEQGEDAAKIVYALSRSRRINFAYSIAERPEILRKGFGKYIPFTTWGRNVASRMLQDVEEGNISKLATRVGSPFLVIEALRAAGIEIPGLNPGSSVFGLLSLQINPLLGNAPGALEAASKGNFGPASRTLPFVAAGSRIQRGAEAISEGDFAKAIGIRDADDLKKKESLPRRIINDLLNPYRLRGR